MISHRVSDQIKLSVGPRNEWLFQVEKKSSRRPLFSFLLGILPVASERSRVCRRNGNLDSWTVLCNVCDVVLLKSESDQSGSGCRVSIATIYTAQKTQWPTLCQVNVNSERAILKHLQSQSLKQSPTTLSSKPPYPIFQEPNRSCAVLTFYLWV